MTFGKWVGFAVLLVALVVLWEIRQLVLLILTAVFLADALGLLVNKLQQWGIKRGSAVAIAFALLIAGIVGLFWLIVPPFTEQFEQLAVRIIQSLQRLNEWLLEYKANLDLDPEWIEALPDLEDAIAQLQPLINQTIDRGLGFFSNTFNVLLNTLLVAVLTLMILSDPQPYRQGFIRLFPSFYRRRVDEILVLCDRDLQGWLVGVAVNMAAIGTFSFVGLSLLGIPLAFAQAILAALFTLIPNIGPVLSVIPPVAIAFLDAPWKPLAVLILYVAIQQLESNFLTPYIMAKQVALLPAVTLLAQVFFTKFFGILGLFLALPLTVVGQIWIKEVLLKDVLDRWQKPKKNIATAAVSQPPTPENPPIPLSSPESNSNPATAPQTPVSPEIAPEAESKSSPQNPDSPPRLS